ncbi:hypothetical protein ABW20_dc0109513 [Dactylellina cionopaga]|nr:hypothetical protein ABW20_dc0109513 [Dactylellina cionopaga]
MTNDYFQNVLLIGATGALGKYILTALLNLSTTHPTQPIKLTILTRSSSSAKFPSYPSVKKTLKGDIASPEFLSEAFKGQDIIISAISPYALLQQKEMLTVAAEVGVKRFIVAEFGPDTEDKTQTDAAEVFKQNREVLRHAQEVCKSSGMTYSGVIPGIFFEMCLLDGELGFEFETRTAHIYGGGGKKIEVSRLGDVGIATAELIFQPDKWANQFVYFSNWTVSQGDILDALNKVDEKGPWKVVDRPTEWLKKRGDKKVAEGNMEGLVDEAWAVMFSQGLGEPFSKNRELVNQQLGITENGIEDFVEAIRVLVGEWEGGRRD